MDITARDKIIAKVKKCLALAKSGNEHEAAAALRQAQKLMATHGISDLDIEHADIQEEAARAGAAFKPARWECELAVRVARTFDCQVLFGVAPNRAGRWIFVGAAPSGEIARYAFEVLFRQAKRARADYIKTALKRCTTTRTRRADLFCEGWVSTATLLAAHHAGNPTARARVTDYLAHQPIERETLKARDRNAGSSLSARGYGDFAAGHRAGRDAQLNRGLGGAGGMGERAALGVS